MERFLEWQEKRRREGGAAFRPGGLVPDFPTMVELWQRGINRPGATLDEFFAAYGIPLRTVHNWLSGARTPPPYVLWLLLYAMESDDFKPLNYK